MAAPIVRSFLRERLKYCQLRSSVSLSTRYFYSTQSTNKHYDLIVIGGGSGGLSCAKEASRAGKNVAVLDYVKPTAHGTKWGLGGTCVNVGCIPKKLMHHASLLGGAMHNARHYGWQVPEEGVTNDWATMSTGVQGFVKSINWGYRVQLKSQHIDYHNALGRMVDPNTVRATFGNGKEEKFSADNVVIATGMRPKYPDIPGARELCITSDDIFWLKEPPGKTLCVGASYVSLECAGFLTGLGYDTTVVMRSIPLRGFDRQCSDLVVDAMRAEGTHIHVPVIPTSVERVDPNTAPGGHKLKVTYTNTQTGETGVQGYDTVMLAIGRSPETLGIGLEDIGVQLDSQTGRIVGGHGGEAERTSVSNVYAIGDILQGAPELTPVAMMAGRLLAKRMFGTGTRQMEYQHVATTVFTPLEYACVGVTEEHAIQEYGEDNLEVYHAFYRPLEFNVAKNNDAQCYIKAIVERSGSQKVLGLHFLGPNAGEVMQGFALAFKLGFTYEDLYHTVGIHPTSAEEVTNLHITKRSGLDPTVTSC